MFGFERATSSPMRPSTPSGKPLPSSFVHVLPASAVFQIAVPGPPPLKPQEVRRRWYDAAYRVFVSTGSITMSVKPVSSSMNLTLAQVLPPSVVLYIPRSLFGPNRRPSAATYTVLASFGSTTMRAMVCVSFNPTLVNVLPPSVDLLIPSPKLELWRLFGSPVPTQTMFGSDWQTARSPIEDVEEVSKIGSQVVPLLTVFHTPPVAHPT